MTDSSRLRSINENKARYVTVSFYDENGDAVTPTTVEWRFYCDTTDAEVAAWATETPATSVTITVPSTYNVIRKSTNKRELKLLMVSADRGLSTEWNQEISWYVTNRKAR